jgi:hypothetical protein
VIIVATSFAFTKTDIHGIVGLFILFVILAHIPMVFTLVENTENVENSNEETAEIDTRVTVPAVDHKGHDLDHDLQANEMQASAARVFGLNTPAQQLFPFNAHASAGVNSRVLHTLPRQRRGALTGNGLYY